MNGTQSKPKVSYIFIQIIIVQVFIKFGARYSSGHTQPCNLRFTHKIRRRIPYSSVSCGTTPLLLHTLSVCLAVLECVEYRASYLSFGLCVVCTQHANHHLPSFLMFQRGLWDLLEVRATGFDVNSSMYVCSKRAACMPTAGNARAAGLASGLHQATGAARFYRA